MATNQGTALITKGNEYIIANANIIPPAILNMASILLYECYNVITFMAYFEQGE